MYHCFLYKHRAFLAGTLLLLLLSACEDPSNVGIGLVGEQGEQPRVVTVPASQLEREPMEIITGGVRGTNAPPPRVLAGRVVDPLFGTITTTGYLDFGSVSTTSDFKEGPVTEAELRLSRDYIYGDTTGTVTLRLRELPAEFDPVGATADTTFTAGGVVTEFSFAATDTLVVVPLPSSYVTANDTTLRSTSFLTSFHGFQLEQVSDQAVVGFDAATQFRVIAGGDTANYPVRQTFTGITRTGEVEPPAERVALQDGVGLGAVFSFDFDEAVSGGALNRTLFNLYADTTAVQEAPAGFYRPLLRSFNVVAVTENGGRLSLGSPSRFSLSDGRFVLDTNALNAIVQQRLLGESQVTHFEIIPVNTSVSINPVLLYDTMAEERAPEAVLTLTPID